MRIAHLSDLHFSKFSLSPLQFFSKRWLGNLNFLLFRRKEHELERLKSLPSLFKKLNISYVVISGDLSTTSQASEFEMAKQFIESLRDLNIGIFTIPGNHDHYTKSAFRKKQFYSFFNSSFGACPFNLKDHGVTATPLEEGWWLIALDTALSTSLYLSTGYFSEEIERCLRETLNSIPKDQKIILLNHFPLFEMDHPRKRLRRASHLLDLLLHTPSVQLYLHGHTHRHCIADLRKNGLPIILDAGSTTEVKTGGWHLIDLNKDQVEIQKYRYTEGEWVIPSLENNVTFELRQS